MSPEETIRIITDEQLYISLYNWFEERRAIEDEVGIIKREGFWQVYTASERANPYDIKEYNVIEVALDDFIQRLRDNKKNTDKLIETVFNTNQRVKEFMKRRLTKWKECEDRIFSVC